MEPMTLYENSPPAVAAVLCLKLPLVATCELKEALSLEAPLGAMIRGSAVFPRNTGRKINTESRIRSKSAP